MINENQRVLLHDVDSELNKARFNLFKAAVYLEKLDAEVFRKTIGEIKKTIKDLHSASDEIVDFMNNQDFKQKSLVEQCDCGTWDMKD